MYSKSVENSTADFIKYDRTELKLLNKLAIKLTETKLLDIAPNDACHAPDNSGGMKLPSSTFLSGLARLSNSTTGFPPARTCSTSPPAAPWPRPRSCSRPFLWTRTAPSSASRIEMKFVPVWNKNSTASKRLDDQLILIFNTLLPAPPGERSQRTLPQWLEDWVQP